MVYVRDDIPSKEINKFDIGGGTEGIFIELNFRKSKWLLLAASDVSKVNCFDNITKALVFYSNTYENVIVMGDLNTLHTDDALSEFLEEHFLSTFYIFQYVSKARAHRSNNDK